MCAYAYKQLYALMHMQIMGKHKTDHNPPVPLLRMKYFNCLPSRILTFRLYLDRFSYDIKKLLNACIFSQAEAWIDNVMLVCYGTARFKL